MSRIRRINLKPDEKVLGVEKLAGFSRDLLVDIEERSVNGEGRTRGGKSQSGIFDGVGVGDVGLASIDELGVEDMGIDSVTDGWCKCREAWWWW